jgi:RecA/RadA recombinase
MMHHVIRTPIDTLNILGGGGLKAGSIVQAYGPPASGKSTFCYQSASIYQKDHPDAVIHIIDVENSVDLLRLKHVFQLDMDRVRIHNLHTLERAFKLIIDCADQMSKQAIGKIQDGRKQIKILSKSQLEKLTDDELFKYAEQFKVLTDDSKTEPFICPKDYDNDREKVMKALALAGAYRVKDYGNMIPTLIIWDTIAVSRPEAEYEKIAEGNMGKNAAGMNLSTQVISQKLCSVLSTMGGKPLTLFLPNQVRLKGFGSYGGPTEGFYGSYAIEHNCHYILKFDKINNRDSRLKNYDEDIKMKTGTDFRMKIEKTKFCPATKDVALYINDARGGLIVPKDELANVALDLGLLKKVHGGYELPSSPEIGKLKWLREESDGDNYISGNTKVRNVLMEEITRHYRKSYFTLDLLYNEVGLSDFGKPSAQDLEDSMKKEDGVLLEELFDNPFSRK